MLTIFIIIAVAYVSLKCSPYVMAFFEKEHVRGDIEPKEYLQAEWNSKYLMKQEFEANAIGLKYCGSYFTSKNGSVVKGYMLLFVTPENDAVVSLISARFGGSELKKAVVSTRFKDGSAFQTSDGFQLPDYTGGIAKQTIYRVSIVELLVSHKSKLSESGKSIESVSSNNSFRIYEDIEFSRGERMVARGYGRWVDPAQTKIRRTLKGVFAAVKANKREKDALIKRELAKRKKP